jgi:hypothetical protein
MTLEHNRLEIMESLRPSKKKTLADLKNFFVNDVFNIKKAVTMSGMYVITLFLLPSDRPPLSQYPATYDNALCLAYACSRVLV